MNLVGAGHLNIPRAYPGHLMRELDELSRGGVGKLIVSLDFMLRVALIPCGLIIMAETTKTNFYEFKGKDYGFVAVWLKTKGLHKLCSVFLLKVY